MRSVVTVGNFDGVHQGHRALVADCVRRAEEDGARPVAMFFDPHPGAFFRPSEAPPQLTTSSRRAELLSALGIAAVDIRPFDEAFAALSAEQFAREILAHDHGASAVVVGPDFRFGRGRGGSVEGLREWGDELDFDVHVIDAVCGPRGGVLSSTRIREALARGDVAEAGAMLGRVHDVEGVVVHGDHRGRTIGFPTANLDPGPTQLPADGVYAVVARRLDSDELWRGVANLGVRPTFSAGRSVEVHLFDFDGDLYGARLRVGFAERVRSEQRFENVEALVAQIGSDAKSARKMLDAMDEERFRWM